MKTMKQHRRLISWMIMGAFLCLVQVSAAPPASGDEIGSSEENVAVSAAVAEEGAGVGAVEKESAITKVSKKKFPWLLVLAGVIAVGAVLYFTVLKKPKYTLTVTVGEGVEGTPIAGAVEYKKGTVVAYNFTAKTGYKKLTVTLDGTPIADSGNVTMNADHTLLVSATEGIEEQFTSSASSLWKPWHPSAWYVSSGYYRCNSAESVFVWEHNILNYRFQKNQYVAEVKMRRTAGSTGVNQGVALFTSSNTASVSGYMIVYSVSSSPSYGIYKIHNQNYQLPLPVPEATIKTSSTSTINSGLNAWNTLRITRSGSNYTLAINGTNVYTFSDSSYDVRYIALLGACIGTPNAWDFDHVIVTMGSSLASAPSFPAATAFSSGPVDPYETMIGRKNTEQ